MSCQTDPACSVENSTDPDITNFMNLHLHNESWHFIPAPLVEGNFLRSNYCDHEIVEKFARALEFVAKNCSEFVYSERVPAITWTLTVVYFIVFVLGTVGNVLTLAVICKTPQLQSHTNYFLASLAASDILLLWIGVPADLWVLWQPNRPPSIFEYCKINSTLISYFTNVSILTIVTLTAERYVAICYPFNIQSIFDKSRVMICIQMIWLIAFFPSFLIGMQASTAITFVLPMVFILFCYLRILRTLSKITASTVVHRSITASSSDDSAQLHVHTHNAAPPRSRAQAIVMKMLAIVTAVFFACYLPFHIQRLIVLSNTDKKFEEVEPVCHSVIYWLLYPITGQLQYVSAALNPIIYNAMSMRFRAAFRFWIHRIFARGSDGYEGVTQQQQQPNQQNHHHNQHNNRP